MRTKALLLVLAASCSLSSQTVSKQAPKSTVPVYVSHAGQDVIGNDFVDAVKRALSKSEKYKVDSPNVAAHERGFQLHLDVVTLEVASAENQQASVASVTAEEMGLPNSWPVQVMWYHKAFLVKADRLDELAQKFIADMDAHWCNYIKNSVGNCPKETIPPIYP